MDRTCFNCAHRHSTDNGSFCYHPDCKLSDPVIWRMGNDCRNIYVPWCRGGKFHEKEQPK